jgi:hypothetical protein
MFKTLYFFSYNRAKSRLLNVGLKNAKEEREANEMLLKIYSNLAICYWEKKEYKKVCIMFNDARRACEDLALKHVKLLYQ